MKRIVFVVSVSLALVAAAAGIAPLLTRTFYVSATTPTLISASSGRKSFLLQNQGPNAEWCQLGGDGGMLAVGNGVQVTATGGSWGMVEEEGWPVWCITTGTAQVGDGGTSFTETR